MKIRLPQLYFSKLMRAVVEFEMIEDGDSILLGISGGKDSIFLAYAMAILRIRLKKDFRLHALTINPMFKDGFPEEMQRVGKFMEELEIPYDTVNVDIAGAIEEQKDKSSGGYSPCFTCAYFRRGAMNRFALAHGCNKIAYAHHHDDAVETFLMSLFYSGQLETFTPVTYLDRTNLHVIRPLCYFREQEITDAIESHGFRPVPSPCPYDGHTVRQEAKELIARLEQEIPDFYAHLGSAMRRGALGELWPAAKNRDEMRDTYFRYMGRQ